ncbi:MAG: hypothetical protein V2I41_18220 [Pseudomonadales bacterium]|jgi:hypothetical protein|nr:hypothetical protein [Pseudomonadales bacterium]
MTSDLKNCLPALCGVLLSTYAATASSNSAAFDYRMNCEGCHAVAGVGVEPHVPALKDNLVPFLHTSLGREYLIRVPGVRQVSISDARIANLLNYVVFTLSDIEEVHRVQPFSEAEVAAHRKHAYLDVPAARQRAIDAYEAK